jgi:hypothetical protein
VKENIIRRVKCLALHARDLRQERKVETRKTSFSLRAATSATESSNSFLNATKNCRDNDTFTRAAFKRQIHFLIGIDSACC